MVQLRHEKLLIQTNHSVLFVTSQLRQREIKIAYALKMQGWIVGLIYYNSTPFKPDSYFDFSIEVNSVHKLYQYAKLLSPSLVHVFSGAIDDVVLSFCKNKIAPVVIDLNDLFVPSLMKYCEERFAPTKKALSLADGFCARDLQIQCAKKIDHYKIPNNILLYPEYCWGKKEIKTENSKRKEDEIHIVSVGTVSLETYNMYDCCYLELIKHILKQEMHFHIYPPWCYRNDYLNKSNFAKDYAQYIELAKQSPYLHIHDSVVPELLTTELKTYDFGIISGGCHAFGQRYTHFNPNYVESCYSGRISDFLDAGLPILINEEVLFNYRLLRHYGAAVDLKAIFNPNFKLKLQKIKRDRKIQNNIARSIKYLSIEKNASRLTAFYKKIMNNTVSQPKSYKNIFSTIKKLWLNSVKQDCI